MGHILSGLGAVPVPSVLRNQRDYARREVVLLGVGGNDPFAFGAHKDLIRRVRVPTVAGAGHEMDLRESKIVAVLASDRCERVDLAGEDVGDAPRGLSHLGRDHPHTWMVARVGQTWPQ